MVYQEILYYLERLIQHIQAIFDFTVLRFKEKRKLNKQRGETDQLSLGKNSKIIFRVYLLITELDLFNINNCINHLSQLIDMINHEYLALHSINR